MFLILILLSNNDTTSVDTVQTYEIPEIVGFQDGMAVTGEIVPAFYEQSSTDVLSALPFLTNNYGFGQQAFVSAKGCNPQYTRIYINGRPLHVHPLGYVSLAQLPLHSFERMQYGSSPSGSGLSAVNFETRVNRYEKPYSNAFFSFGSFESTVYGLDLTRAVNNDLGFYLSGQYYKTGGYRENTDANLMSVYSNVYCNRFLPMRLDIRYINNEYGFPGSDQVFLNGRETDQTIDVAGTFGFYNSAVTFSYDYGNIEYVDSIMDKALAVRSDQFGALVARHDTLQGAVVSYGANGYLTALDGGDSLPTRLSEGEIWAQGRVNSGRFFVQAGGLLGRGNFHEAFFCPKAEFGVKIVESLDLRAAFSRDVRLPSDFEKWAPFDPSIPYFTVAGNKVLEPEYCLAGEIGLRGERLMLNLYRLYFTDLIAVHVENGYNPFYMNVNSWEASGVEGHLSYPIRIYSSDSGALIELAFTGSFNALMSGDSLLYVPPQYARAGVSIRRSSDRFSFGVAMRGDFSGVRHDIYGVEHAGFSVYSLAALVRFLSLSCVVRLNNVFDESYTSIPYYPMAPRNYDISVKWEFWD